TMTRSRGNGSRAWAIDTLRARASIEIPRQACRSRKTAAADQACGAHATGYDVGGSHARRWNPQNSSGRRRSSNDTLASTSAERTRAAMPGPPYLAPPAATSALSCGQIEPLWYDIGL